MAGATQKRLHRGQRQRRVLCLVRTVQRQEDFVVRTAEALQALDEEYGGAEAYLSERAGLQPATLTNLRDQLVS